MLNAMMVPMDMNEDIDRTILFPVHQETEESMDDAHLQNTVEIVSIMAYLTGVRESIFDNPYTSADKAVYNELEESKDARIVRALSALRTAINLNFRRIDEQITIEMKNINVIEETKQLVKALHQDGVEIYKANTTAEYYVNAINQLLMRWIDRCRQFFPEWIEWKYIRSLFVFPAFNTKAKAYFDRYQSNLNRLPYQVFINWNFRTKEDFGNVFQNDQKFLSLLYEQFNDTFTRYGSVHSESQATRNALSQFAVNAGRMTLMVDCENSDPLKLCAALQSLDDTVRARLVHIVLVNDVNTSICWEMLAKYCSVPVEHCMTQRVLLNKSLVDGVLIAKACCEHYQNRVDSFLLASSDSDFISLVRSLPDVNFLWLVENSKVSDATLNELVRSNVPVCHLDEFNDGGIAYKFQKDALLDKCQEFLAKQFTSFNLDAMLEYALLNTRIQMGSKDRQSFKKKFLETIRASIDASGNLCLKFGG